MLRARMEILFVTPECAPYSGSSGAAHVCRALPKALRGIGHKVTVVSPLYRGIDPTARSLARRLMKLEVEVEGRTWACEMYDGRTPGGVDLMFIGHEELFRRAESLEDGDAHAIALRAGVFAKAVALALSKRERKADVIHAHDWLGGLAIVHAARTDVIDGIATLLTVHDFARPGAFERDQLAALGLDEGALPDLELGGRLNVLRAALRAAGHVTTVSETYAREVIAEGGAGGLEDELREIGERFTGILDGVDVAVWNPTTDAALPVRFDPIDASGKARCKVAFQRELGLPARTDVPLIGAIGTGARDEGFDLLAKVAIQVLRNDVQLAVQVRGDDELVSVFRELSERWPDRLQVRDADDEVLTHRILGCSDLLVVPARRAPAGLLQMYAHRYGTLPIARRTGGVADTVVDCDASLATGSGFLYDDPTPDDLLSAIRRAIAAFSAREAFEALSQRVMRIDHSWERSARLYDRSYRVVRGD